MKAKHSYRGLAMLAGAVAAGQIIRRLIPRRMPDRLLFERELAREWGPTRTADFGRRMQARYDTLMAGRPHYRHPALRMHLENNILPGLALYQSLREEYDEATALAMVERLFARLARTPRAVYMRLGNLPGFYRLIRLATPLLMRLMYPASGWRTEWLENSDRRVAFDIHSCFYADVLRDHGAPELTPQFCRLDDLIYDRAWPTVQWGRTQTIARGSPRCDFRFEHKPVPRGVVISG